MLQLEGLTTDYGPVRALDEVSLRVQPGSVTAVLGANGAGKTTLLRTVSGLVRPAAGAVSFDGAEFSGGTVGFDGAVFSGARVSFAGAKFSGGRVSFDGALPHCQTGQAWPCSTRTLSLHSWTDPAGMRICVSLEGCSRKS